MLVITSARWRVRPSPYSRPTSSRSLVCVQCNTVQYSTQYTLYILSINYFNNFASVDIQHFLKATCCTTPNLKVSYIVVLVSSNLLLQGYISTCTLIFTSVWVFTVQNNFNFTRYLFPSLWVQITDVLWLVWYSSRLSPLVLNILHNGDQKLW